MTLGNLDFPFMTEEEIKTYYQAVDTEVEQRTEAQRVAVRKKYNGTEALMLWELIEKLMVEGLPISERMQAGLEALWMASSTEGVL